MRRRVELTIADFSEAGQDAVEAIAKNGTQAIFIKTDVADSASVQAMVAQTLENFGRIDVLFANAGIAADGPIDVLSEEAWQRTIDINLTGVYLCDKGSVEFQVGCRA